MPQMAPIWWLFLFILFTTIFIMMWTVMYYQIFYMIKQMSDSNMKLKTINWKW